MTRQAPEIALVEPYSFFIRCFERPGPAQFELFRHPDLPAFLADMAATLEVAMPDSLEPPPSYQDLESTYIAVFDAGVPAPPAPLIASHYSRRDPVPKVLHEHVLFYQTFGLRLRDDNGETADHLLNELEFLARLARLQDAAPDDKRARSIRLARRDFLARHTADWVPRAAEAAERAAPPFYAFLLRLLAAWARRDLREQEAWLMAHDPELAATVASAPSGPRQGREGRPGRGR